MSTLGGQFHEKEEWTQDYNEKLQGKHKEFGRNFSPVG